MHTKLFELIIADGTMMVLLGDAIETLFVVIVIPYSYRFKILACAYNI